MAIRTRADMHIGLDLMLNTLNATPTNRMDPVIKDYFLNDTIAKFVKKVINKVNAPDESKRVPFRILTYGDILNKYNDIYTLIKIDDSLVPISFDNNTLLYTLPTDLFRFETSSIFVRPNNCITYPSAIAPTLSQGVAGNVNVGLHYYFVTFLYGTVETDAVVTGVANTTIATSAKQVAISNIPLGLTGCTGRKIYRTIAGGKWYEAKLLTTLANNSSTTYTDNTADASLGVAGFNNTHDTELQNVLISLYDRATFNNNPFGGKKKLIATYIDSTGLKVDILNRYAVSKFNMIYIKKPAVLTSSPTIINCDLPESVHDDIVEDTAKFIAAAVTSGNYEHILNEVKLRNQ